MNSIDEWFKANVIEQLQCTAYRGKSQDPICQLQYNSIAHWSQNKNISANKIIEQKASDPYSFYLYKQRQFFDSNQLQKDKNKDFDYSKILDRKIDR